MAADYRLHDGFFTGAADAELPDGAAMPAAVLPARGARERLLVEAPARLQGGGRRR
jgi:hypothetical protein